LRRIGFPRRRALVNDLNGIQRGKFQGTIEITGPRGSVETNAFE